MKVAIISQLPPPIHGSTLMTRVLLETLEGQGVEWRLVDRRFSRTVGEVGAFHLRKLFAAIGLHARLILCLRAFSPDAVIHFATNRRFSFLVDWLLSELLRPSRPKVILYLHTVGYESLAAQGRAWAWIVRRLLTSADMVVCLGPSLHRDIARWVPIDRVRFIANTPPDMPPPAVRIDHEGPVLFLSNALPEKGPDTFIELAARISAAYPERRFVLAGSQTSEQFEVELRERIRNADLDGRLTRVEVRDAPHKWRLLRECAVFVLPSRYPFEAQPLVVIEAMASGRPVVAFDIGGVGDVVLDGETGYLISTGDIDAMAERLIDLLSRDTLSNEISQRALRRYADFHSSESFSAAWYEALRHVVASGSTHTAEHQDDLKGR